MTSSGLTSEQQTVLVHVYFFLWFRFDFIAHECLMTSWEDTRVLPSPGTGTYGGNWRMQLSFRFLTEKAAFSTKIVCFHGPFILGSFQVQKCQQTWWWIVQLWSINSQLLTLHKTWVITRDHKSKKQQFLSSSNIFLTDINTQDFRGILKKSHAKLPKSENSASFGQSCWSTKFRVKAKLHQIEPMC